MSRSAHDAHTAAFEEALQRAELARLRSRRAGEAISAYPKGAMGLTPDAVKALPSWRAAKAECDAAFAAERAANAYITKRFPAELRAHRARERAAKLAALDVAAAAPSDAGPTMG